MKQHRFFELSAEVCNTLSNPFRLKIIIELQDNKMTGCALAKKLIIQQAHPSQHLSVLWLRGVLNSRKEGVSVHCSIANPQMIKACNPMREVLMGHLKQEQSILARMSQLESRSFSRTMMQVRRYHVVASQEQNNYVCNSASAIVLDKLLVL
jgi:ArsR family transcriptional regulator, virulence genes transcriptional regulator